jgi:hypothetical protein
VENASSVSIEPGIPAARWRRPLPRPTC